MSLRLPFPCLMTLTLCLFSEFASAQKAGDRMTVITRSADLMDAEKVVARVYLGESGVIRDVQGPWVELDVGRASGYIRAEQLVPEAEAIDQFTKMLSDKPNDAEVLVARGNAHASLGKDDEAIVDYTAAIAAAPTNSVAYNNRGNAWRRKKEFAKAVADYSEAIRIFPEFGAAYRGRAWLRATCADAKVRDGKAAVADAKKAVELSKGADLATSRTLAAAYAEAGQFDRAVAEQEKVMAKSGSGPGADAEKARLELYRNKKPYRYTEGN